MTTLSGIIPTIATDLDRLSLLKRSVESGLCQLREGDEIIVAGDLRNGPLEAARELCGRLNAEAPEGACVRFVGHDGGRPSWGHDSINHAQTVAQGDYLTYSDDDDVWLPGAFQAMRDAIGSYPSARPFLFRFVTHYGAVVWMQPGVATQGTIGGHCLCTPNLPSFLGTWGPHYEGDHQAIRETLEKWAAVGVEPVWCNRLVAAARPAMRYA